MSEKIECWQCGCEYDEDDCFCPECDADIEPDDCGELLAPSKSQANYKPETKSYEPYLAVRCSQCGSGIMLSPNKMSGNCSHCGTTFVANPDIVKPEHHSAQTAQVSKPIASKKINSARSSKNQEVWVTLYKKSTPECQFCGRQQSLRIGYLFHEMAYLLHCKHCQAEFKCDFTISGKMKDWVAEIICCGKVNQNNLEVGLCGADKLVTDKTKIKRESFKMEWFYKLKRTTRNWIASIGWIMALIVGGIGGAIGEQYEKASGTIDFGTPIGAAVLILSIIMIVGFIIGVFFSIKASRATKRDKWQVEKKAASNKDAE